MAEAYELGLGCKFTQQIVLLYGEHCTSSVGSESRWHQRYWDLYISQANGGISCFTFHVLVNTLLPNIAKYCTDIWQSGCGTMGSSCASGKCSLD